MAHRIEKTGEGRSTTYTLYVENVPVAKLDQPYGAVRFVWAVYGPQDWPAAQGLLAGLLDLGVLADQLHGALQNGRAN